MVYWTYVNTGGRTFVKSFKLLSVDFEKDGDFFSCPLVDGIIINEENSRRSWILEMFVNKEHKPVFDEWLESEVVINAKAVISYPENEPAGFRLAVYAVKEIGDHISVLLKGPLKRVRSQYAEHLLEELIAEGLQGDEMLDRFKSDMKNRPQLKRDRDKQNS